MRTRFEGYRLIVLALVLLIVINYSWLDSFVLGSQSEETATVLRAVDGDTLDVLLEGEEVRLRLLGVNTPERGEHYYAEATGFMRERLVNGSVVLYQGVDGVDQYGRLLRYVSYEDELMNTALVRQGLATPYIYDEDVYTSTLWEAWEACIVEGARLCEASTHACGACVTIQDVSAATQQVKLVNSCSSTCDISGWSLKDEGRKQLTFSQGTTIARGSMFIIAVEKEGETSPQNAYVWKRNDYVWTQSGDTAFLRDAQGKLVDWFHYS